MFHRCLRKLEKGIRTKLIEYDDRKISSGKLAPVDPSRYEFELVVCPSEVRDIERRRSRGDSLGEKTSVASRKLF